MNRDRDFLLDIVELTETINRHRPSCGNSGNTSEPHLHFQLMDTARHSLAAGLPFAFVGNDVPRNEEALVVADNGAGR